MAVLGAGFTRALVPSAPLLIDDYGIDDICQAFAKFPHARRVLASSLLPDGRINIEQLLTRLDSLLPYDFERGAAPELSLLLSAVTDRFRDYVELARTGKRDETALGSMAKYCIDEAVTCITFNYDDVFDEALWKYKSITNADPESGGYWHPDGGYGFFCKPTKTIIRESGFNPVVMDTTRMLLLKLHGSINWRIRRGYSRPLAIDGIVHDEPWLPAGAPGGIFGPDDDDEATLTAEEAADRRRVLNDHLERDPFIVPPVLVKGNHISEPILRLIWSRAFESLKEAHEVTFLGYSMPPTDIAAQYLFREAITEEASIRVVDYTGDGAPNTSLIESYRRTFPRLSDGDFQFTGVVEWIASIQPA